MFPYFRLHFAFDYRIMGYGFALQTGNGNYWFENGTGGIHCLNGSVEHRRIYRIGYGFHPFCDRLLIIIYKPRRIKIFVVCTDQQFTGIHIYNYGDCGIGISEVLFAVGFCDNFFNSDFQSIQSSFLQLNINCNIYIISVDRSFAFHHRYNFS